MTIRDYQNDQIVVHWDSERCIHAAICLRSLPAVFNGLRRPWVSIDAADAEEIAAVVRRCPTGALRYELIDGEPEAPPERTTIVPIPGGPLLMRGRLAIAHPDGRTLTEETRLALCRCGASANRPFCDNSHRRIGFEADRLEPPPSRASAESPQDIGTAQAAPMEVDAV